MTTPFTAYYTPLEIDTLVIKYPGLGSLYEKNGFRGTSHLIEHLMIRAIPSTLLKSLEDDAVDYNAFTSETEVVAYFKGISKYYLKYEEDLLKHFSQLPFCTKEQFDSEKNVVLQEYSRAYDNPTERVFMNTGRALYGYCGPLGLKEDVENFEYHHYVEAVQKLKPEFYILSKRFEKDGLRIELPESRRTRPKFTGDRVATLPKEEEPKSFLPKLLQFFGKSDSSDERVVMFVSDPIDDHNSHHTKLFSDAINAGLTSPLGKYLRDDLGLVYSSEHWIYDLGDKHVLAFLGVTSEPDKLKTAYREFFRDITKHFTPDVFDAHIRSSLIAQEWKEVLPHSGFYAMFDDSLVSYNEDKSTMGSLHYGLTLFTAEGLKFSVVE